MAITLFDSADIGSTMRCAIHIDGRLTFSILAIRNLDLRNKWCIALGKDESDLNKRNLYIHIYEKYKENAFRINGSGPYVYLNTKELFQDLKYDYKNRYIYFYMTEIPNSDGHKSFKLTYREKERARFGS